VEVKQLGEKATVRLICIIASSLLVAFLVPLAATRAWSVSQRISSNNAAYGEGMRRYPALAAQGSDVYAMWSRRVGSSGDQRDPYYNRSSDNGQTWGTDTNLRSAPNTDTFAPLDVTLDASNIPHYVWAEQSGSDYTLYYKYGSNSPQTITTRTEMLTQPAIEVGSSDVHVVWSQGNTNIMYISKAIGSGGWSGSGTNIRSAGSFALHPDIAVDGGGTVHVVWDEGNPGDAEILYKNSNNWSAAPIDIDDVSADGRRPAIAVYGNNVYVVWCEYIGSDTQYVRLRRSANRGSTWGTSERISGSALAVNTAISTYLWSAIAIDSDGKIHVAFNGISSHPGIEDIHYVSGEQGSWSSRQNITDNNNNATTPAIATAGNYVHLIWAEKWSGELYDVYYNRTGTIGSGGIYLPIIVKSY
jgi:hypothetical protein